MFAPDDLVLVKGGPGERRRYLDDALVARRTRATTPLRRDVDRVLRQRNALLKQAGGRLDPEVAATLDVWDAKLAEAGEALGRARRALVADLLPDAAAGLRRGGRASRAGSSARYEPAWLHGTAAWPPRWPAAAARRRAARA